MIEIFLSEPFYNRILVGCVRLIWEKLQIPCTVAKFTFNHSQIKKIATLNLHFLNTIYPMEITHIKNSSGKLKNFEKVMFLIQI